MSPVMAFTFWTDKYEPVISSGHFERHEKVELAIFTMVHIYDRILSPLHPNYTTIAG